MPKNLFLKDNFKIPAQWLPLSSSYQPDWAKKSYKILQIYLNHLKTPKLVVLDHTCKINRNFTLEQPTLNKPFLKIQIC